MTKLLFAGASGQLGGHAIQVLTKKTDKADIVAMIRNDKQAAAFDAKGIATRRGSQSDSDPDRRQRPDLHHFAQRLVQPEFVDGLGTGPIHGAALRRFSEW